MFHKMLLAKKFWHKNQKQIDSLKKNYCNNILKKRNKKLQNKSLQKTKVSLQILLNKKSLLFH